MLWQRQSTQLGQPTYNPQPNHYGICTPQRRLWPLPQEQNPSTSKQPPQLVFPANAFMCFQEIVQKVQSSQQIKSVTQRHFGPTTDVMETQKEKKKLSKGRRRPSSLPPALRSKTSKQPEPLQHLASRLSLAMSSQHADRFPGIKIVPCPCNHYLKITRNHCVAGNLRVWLLGEGGASRHLFPTNQNFVRELFYVICNQRSIYSCGVNSGFSLHLSSFMEYSVY